MQGELGLGRRYSCSPRARNAVGSGKGSIETAWGGTEQTSATVRITHFYQRSAGVFWASNENAQRHGPTLSVVRPTRNCAVRRIAWCGAGVIMNVPSPNITAALPNAPALARGFERIARGEPSDLLSDLVALEAHAEMGGTRAQTHCYALALDGMGWPRAGLLVDTVCSLVIEYAIPRSKIREAVESCNSGHLGPIQRLAAEARSLFTHLNQTGEGGELLLFCLAELVLGFPQVMAKMHLKTAPAVHYHGADGVHASVDPETGKLCLWWGESKLHKTAAGATRECLKSLAPLLTERQSSTAKRARELQLLRYGIDLDDAALEGAIRAYLDIKSPFYRKLKFGGVGLVGFNHSCYPPHPQQANADAIAKAVAKSSAAWKTGFGKAITEHELEEIDIHLFFLPFPSVSEFRKAVLKGVGAT